MQQWNNYVPITKENYSERVKDMKSLAPEWKSLDFSPISVHRLFEPDIYLHQKDFPFSDETTKHELKAKLTEEEQSFLNAQSMMDEAPEKEAEYLIRRAWEEYRIPIDLSGRKIIQDVEEKIGYKFQNEFLCVQAFTRRSFTKGCGDVWGCKAVDQNNESLEFFGDSAINGSISRMIRLEYCSFGAYDNFDYGRNLFTDGDEGKFTKIRSDFSCKDYLAKRGEILGFGQYVRQKGKEITVDVLEDTVEAVIGAVAVDCEWDPDTLDGVVGQALDICLPASGIFTERDYYEDVYRWTQKKFGKVPEVRITRTDRRYPAGFPVYECVVTVPNPGVKEGDKDDTSDTFRDSSGYNVSGHFGNTFKADIKFSDEGIISKGEGSTRAMARNQAAKNLKYALEDRHVFRGRPSESGIVPDEENAINQLQELFQKGYIDEPEYKFADLEKKIEDGEIYSDVQEEEGIRWNLNMGLSWFCSCHVFSDSRSTKQIGFGRTKTEAKKSAAFEMLCVLI